MFLLSGFSAQIAMKIIELRNIFGFFERKFTIAQMREKKKNTFSFGAVEDLKDKHFSSAQNLHESFVFF